MLLKFQ
ncbi:rCG46263 [Rattus norvegicus]|nr:rCG46263 [Rattus norvegicus]